MAGGLAHLLITKTFRASEPRQSSDSGYWGAALVGTLCLVLQKTVRRRPLAYWATGWFALSAALLSLLVAFSVPWFRPLGQAAYIFGEYAFGGSLIAGCRYHITGKRPQRAELLLIGPGLFLAFFLPAFGGGDINVFFPIDSRVRLLFLAAFRALWRALPGHGSYTGLRVMKLALLILAVDYAHYGPLFAASLFGMNPPTGYLMYSPLYDLLFLVLLAFGMVMVMTGEVQHELEVANASLAQTT